MKRDKKEREDKSASVSDGPLFPMQNDDGDAPLAMAPLASIVNRINGN